MTNDQLNFAGVIAYGLAFIATLVAAGAILGRPELVLCAVLVAGGSYATQALTGLAASVGGAAIGWATFIIWVATILVGVVSAILVTLAVL